MNNKYDVDLGATLYDANKQLVKQTEKVLTHVELAGRQENITKFFENNVKEYAMLLCHEQRDYTIFHLNQNSLVAPMTAASEVIGCCVDRGEVVSIEPTDDGVAYEIWINIDDEPYCYYLFPYDQAVIECS